MQRSERAAIIPRQGEQDKNEICRGKTVREPRQLKVIKHLLWNRIISHWFYANRKWIFIDMFYQINKIKEPGGKWKPYQVDQQSFLN